MKLHLGKYTKILTVSCALALLSACGGGGGGGGGGSGTTSGSTSGSSSGGSGSQTGDFALSGIGGRTFNGHITGGDAPGVNWQMVFSGGPTSGTYTHFENGVKLETGSYTYSKSSSTTGIISTFPINQSTAAATLQLTWISANSGTYNVVQFPESGTFTF